MKSLKGILFIVGVLVFSTLKIAHAEGVLLIVHTSQALAFHNILRNVAHVSVTPLLGDEIFEVKILSGNKEAVIETLQSLEGVTVTEDLPLPIQTQEIEFISMDTPRPANLWWQKNDGSIKYKVVKYNDKIKKFDIVREIQSVRGADINLPLAHSVERGDPSIIVGVIDSGLSLVHPAFQNSVYTNPFEIPENGIDDDNNGYVDDIHGWNFATNSPHVTDIVGHGTSVSGVIAGNTKGFQGVCPNCKVLPVIIQKEYTQESTSTTSTYLSSFLRAIDYLSRQGARIINMSFILLGDKDKPATLENPVTIIFYAGLRVLEKQGVVLVAAAGNEGQNGNSTVYPAAFRNTISVGALNPLNTWADFSNFGNWIDIMAPGEEIWTTQPFGIINWHKLLFDPDNYVPGYSYQDGTSFAAPMVAGAAGLLLSHYPRMTPQDVHATLTHPSNTNYVRSLGKPNVRSLNVYRALVNPIYVSESF
ncbi:MAG: S8 family serine peptidase [Deltaproteobacteria bacterium]|nr:S8 family serine peptidase [Deltaproteobacteria bacterium]